MQITFPLVLSMLMIASTDAARSVFCRIRGTCEDAPVTAKPVVQSSNYFSVLNNAQNEHFNCAANTAMGSAVATLTNSTFCIRLSYVGLSTPELFSHIHGPAKVGVVAPVIATLNVEPTKTGCYTFNSTQIDWLNMGLLYFNIHSNTTNCAPGEIRGQILRSA